MSAATQAARRLATMVGRNLSFRGRKNERRPASIAGRTVRFRGHTGRLKWPVKISGRTVNGRVHTCRPKADYVMVQTVSCSGRTGRPKAGLNGLLRNGSNCELLQLIKPAETRLRGMVELYEHQRPLRLRLRVELPALQKNVFKFH